MIARAAAAFLLVASVVPACADAAPAPRRPNVLLVVVDTLRKDHLPVYGYATRETAPALAALAAEPDARVVEGLVGCSSWTKPSMATLFTGLAPADHGVMRLVGPGAQLADPRVLASEFSAAGWDTGCVMSNHLLTRPTQAGFDRGFAYWDDAPAEVLHEGTSSAAVAERGIAWLDRQRGEQPWFLVLHFFDPHAVLVDHPQYPWFEPGYGGWVRGSDSTDRLREHQASCTAQDRTQLAALYDEEVRVTDDAFGRVMAALRARPDWQDTVIVFTSDHGEELAERGLIGHTQTLHTELNDLPLVVRVPAAHAARWALPALPAGGHAQQQLYASLLGVAGIPLPPPPPGAPPRGAAPPYQAAEVDFVPVRAEHREKFVHKRAVVRGPFKLIEDQIGRKFALYDRSVDPYEQNPLPDAHPQRAELEALLRAHRWWESP